MVNQDGLEWVAETFGLEPRWKSEPNISKIELIARKHLKLEGDSFCLLTFYAQGAFNKLYKVETDKECFLFRVTLPVDPHNKTNSEVATINFVREATDIPVPQILAFDDSSDNELGYEWILMDMLPGTTLRNKWRKLPKESKQCLVKQIAQYQVQLFGYKFSTLGNIFVTPETRLVAKRLLPSTRSTDIRESLQGPQILLPALGQMVSLIFFWGDHVTQNVPKGPFTNSKDWILSRLTLILTDQERILKTSEDDDEIEDAKDAKDLAERLLKLLPDIFPADGSPAEQSVIFHNDLSMQNILVDNDGNITGIVDWECVSALPLWRSCDFPGFIKGRYRDEKPERDQYSPDDAGEHAVETGEDYLDNEGVDSLYWEHLLEYELTILRDIFLKEMCNTAPEWMEELRKGTEKADFDLAVQNCDSGWSTKQIITWLDARERGESWSLRKSFLE